MALLDRFLPYAYSQRYYASIPEGESRTDISQRGPLATRLRELIAAWEPPELTAEIRKTATLLLLANGSKEPPGGAEAVEPDPNFPYHQMLLAAR